MIEVDATAQLGAFLLDARFASDGRVTALFGQSGAGKSSLIRMIGGLARPDRGRIALGGRVLFDSASRTDLTPRERRLGHVFQDGLLFPHLTVRQNLLYGRFFSRAPDGPRHRLGDVVDLLGIGHLLKRRPASLSGGERQRVAIGRALLMEPRALLMDEPLASLDHARKAEILPYLDRLKSEAGLPIVYVSHSLEEVARIADTLVILSEGRVAASGPLAEVMGRVDLGPLAGRQEGGAVLRGRVASHDERFAMTTLDISGQPLVLPRIDAAPGRHVRVRILASDVSIAVGEPGRLSIRNRLAGHVVALEEEAGAYAEAAVDIGGQVLRARLTRHAVEELGLCEGAPVIALVKSVAIGRRLLTVEDE